MKPFRTLYLVEGFEINDYEYIKDISPVGHIVLKNGNEAETVNDSWLQFLLLFGHKTKKEAQHSLWKYMIIESKRVAQESGITDLHKQALEWWLGLGHDEFDASLSLQEIKNSYDIHNQNS